MDRATFLWQPALVRSTPTRREILPLAAESPVARFQEGHMLGHPSPQSGCARRQPLRHGSPCVRGATPTSSQARCRLRTASANGLTACRMRLSMACVGSATCGSYANSGHTPAPRPTGDYAAFRFALRGAQRRIRQRGWRGWISCELPNQQLPPRSQPQCLPIIARLRRESVV